MPIDRGIIDQQLQAIGEGSRWWDKRELRDLPAVLHADEHILAISRGKIARVRWLRRPWLIVVTQKRLLFLRSGGRTSWRQLEVTATQISRVAIRLGPFRGRLLVGAANGNYRMLVPRADLYKLQSALTNLATSAQGTVSRFAPTRMVHRVIDHVLALPAVALGPDAPGSGPPPAPANTVIVDAMLEERLQLLEQEVQELRQQVDFLEQLLRQRHPASPLAERLPSG
jgi:hypothetical protein